MAIPPVGQLPEPLRLPHGSVRGTIAIIVTAAYGYVLLQPGASVPVVLVNAVVVVIAFYFGSRAVSTPPVVLPGQPALPVPHHPRLVRILLFLGFAGLAAWFLSRNPSLQGIPPALLAVLEVLGGYILGATASWLVHRRAHETRVRHRLATVFRDVVAAGALGLTAYFCFALVTNQHGVFADRADQALSIVVTFYFGSRVIGH